MTTGADEVRRRNRDLDDVLRSLIADADPASVHRRTGPEEWTVAENLAHLAEFQHFFARDLERWLSDRTASVGRTHDHDQRHAAIGRAPEGTLHNLSRACEHGFATLASVLERLEDSDLAAPTENVKYGREPLRNYLLRYVLDHKVSHESQIRAALASARSAEA